MTRRSHSLSLHPAFRVGLSRRTLLGGTLGGTLALLDQRSGWGSMPARADAPRGRTWLLDQPDELRPHSPGAPTRAELDELLDFQARRTDATRALVARWHDGPAVVPWTTLALDVIKAHKPSPVRAGRALALLHAATVDTVTAVLDARTAYPRPAPAALDERIEPLVPMAQRSSFPSEHAAVAGAAVAILTDLFPDEPAERLAALEQEAATSGLWTGANVRGDIDAGLAIGRAVAAKARAWAKADGSDAVWAGTRPTGEGLWQPTPPGFIAEPLDPLAGTWRPWVLERGDQFRPMAPPPYGSLAWDAELAAVQDAVAGRTPEQEAAVHFWAGGPGTVTPAGLWVEIARDLILRDGLDLPEAARVLALTSVAMFDAFVCCWDAKYAYWMARPITADPSLAVLIPTPPFPSYTSGHSTVSAAAATVLGHFFPADEANLTAQAEEAKDSRLWAGIHFPIDNDVGAVGGRLVGRLVVASA